jgi:hypothetical protein
MKNDIDNLVKGGERIYESALAVLCCALGASITAIIATLITKIQ